MKRYRKYIMPAITLFATLGIWEACVRIFDVDLYILPAPSKIVEAMLANADVLWNAFHGDIAGSCYRSNDCDSGCYLDCHWHGSVKEL